MSPLDTFDRTYEYGLGLTSQFYFCGLPLRLDTYSRCAFQCAYCFAHGRGGAHRDDIPKVYPVDRLRKRFERLQAGRQVGVVDELLQHGQPIHFGGMSDPFSSIERKHRASLDVLNVLADVRHPTVISTKSDMLVQDAYLETLSRGRFLVQVSLSSMDEKLIANVDRGTPGPNRIIDMLKTLKSCGIPTACRIQPLLPGHEDHAKDVIEASASVGVKHVAVEHLKLGVEKMWRGTGSLALSLGVDLNGYFKTAGARRVGREWVLPPSARIETTIEMRDMVHSFGMTFGAADTDFLLLSDGGCCCSGSDLTAGFENYFRCTYVEAARIGSRTGSIQLGNISDVWAPSGSIAECVNSNSRLPAEQGKGAGIRRYLEKNWNGSSNGPSPQGLYGIDYAGEVDHSGNKIYRVSKQLRQLLKN